MSVKPRRRASVRGAAPPRSARLTLAPARTSCLEAGDVPLAAVAEYDRFDQRRPAKLVDVVERCLGGDQRAHNLVVAEMGGGNQRRAVIGAGDVRCLAAKLQCELEHRHVIGDGGNGDDVVALRLERVGVGAATCQSLGGAGLFEESRDMQRCAAVTIAGIDQCAGGAEALDRGDVACGAGRVQALIGGNFGRAGRNLRQGRARRPPAARSARS
jgi:hypothetical protein